MNNSIKILMIAIPAVVLGALATFMIVDPQSALAQRAPTRLQPYEIHSGQVYDGFEVFYIVDPQNQQVVAIGYDRGNKKLEGIGARDLAADFKTKTMTSFSVSATQLNKSTGLLLVVNHTMQRAIIYEVDQTQKDFKPRDTMDLSKVFKTRR